MKNYHIRLLPTDDELNVGDLTFWDSDEGYFSKNFLQVTDSFIDHARAMGWKKYQPFVCTKDLRIGESFRSVDQPHKEFIVDRLEMGSGENYYPAVPLVWHRDGQFNFWFIAEHCFHVICKVEQLEKYEHFYDDYA